MKTYTEFINENQIDNEEWKEIATEIDAIRHHFLRYYNL